MKKMIFSKWMTLLVFFFVKLAKLEVIKEDDVLVLDQSNFAEALTKFTPLMLEFYAPWCGHCKEFAPHYKQAAEILKSRQIYLAKIDATTNLELATRYNIQSYPTVYYIVNGEKIEYTEQRDAQILVKWCITYSMPVMNYVKVKRKFEQLRQDFDLIFAYFPQGEKMETDQKVLESISKKNRLLFLLVIVQGEQLKNKLGVLPNQRLVLFFTRESIPFEGVISPMLRIINMIVSSIEIFLWKNQRQLLSKFTPIDQELIFKDRIPTIVQMYDSKKNSTHNLFNNEIAKEFQYQIIFSSLDLTNNEIRKQVEKTQVYRKVNLKLPCIYIFDTRFEPFVRYQFDGEFNQESVRDFIKKWQQGLLNPFVKTASAPELNDGPVRILVGSTFRKEVYESKENVLVEFYAPWCHHCKKFGPVYEEIGQLCKGNRNLMIAKMDSTENESEGIEISSYPSIKLIKKSEQGQSIMDFDGDRNKEAVLDFLKGHLGSPLCE